MEDFSLGDLYDDRAREFSDQTVCKESIYECRFCPGFELTGLDLLETALGRVHAASHRIAFEALAESTVYLTCPICEEAQYTKQSSSASVFDCMFNDLDLVKHLETDHFDMLSEEMLGDFSQINYLLTTFVVKRSGPIITSGNIEAELAVHDNFAESNHDRSCNGENMHPLAENTCESSTSMTLDDECFESSQDAEIESVEPEPVISSELDIPQNVDTVIDNSMQVETIEQTNPIDTMDKTLNSNDVSFNSDECGVAVECNETDATPDTSIWRPCSKIMCNVCNWEAIWSADAMEFRKTIALHIRSHIRIESEKRLNDPNVFYAAKRLLCCMDFSLEEYFEKDLPTDLSGTVNAQLMEKTYQELLVKLFGVTFPLVMRILHGIRGNPFRKGVNRRRKVKETPVLHLSKVEMITIDDETSDDALSKDSRNERVLDEMEAENDYIGNLDETTHCCRPECGNAILTGDGQSLARHIAAHIRHDETRLNSICSPLICHCGMTVYSPNGYVYHVFRDHTFEKNTFDGAAKTFMSYLNLLFESMLKSCTSHMDQEAAQKAWGWKTGIPNWRAYFSLESDDGEEVLWSDCSTVNGAWLKLWNDFIEEGCGRDETSRPVNLSMGDVFKLMEMHPFVDFLDPPIRKRRIYIGSDDKLIIRSVSTSSRLLSQWLNGEEAERFRIAPASRWKYLQDRKKRLFRLSRRIAYGTPEPTTFAKIVATGLKHFESIVVGSASEISEPTTSNVHVVQGQLLKVASCPSNMGNASNYTAQPPLINNNVGFCFKTPATNVIALPDVPVADMDSTEDIPIAAPNAYSERIECRYCKGLTLPADDANSIKMHTAQHMIAEMRYLCSLYIHRHSEKPLTCPFCNWEIPVYRPQSFIEHLGNHRQEVMNLCDVILSDDVAISNYFDESTHLEPNTINVPNGPYVIRCQRFSKCCWDEVLSLPSDHSMSVQDVDVTILKHMLWHVRNDDEMDLTDQERDLMTNTIMSRLSGGSSIARQMVFAARKALKHFWPGLLHREPDVLRFIIDKINWMGHKLFGPNKGFVFLMTFPRRWVREQCGPALFPTCACNICLDKELPKYSADRRKRVFVAYTHPVTSHVLEHLAAGEIETSDKVETKCPLDGVSFKNVSAAVKHILDNHNSLVEINGLPIILQKMGVLDVFESALSNVLGDQSWQLKQALGFDASTVESVNPAAFFAPVAENEEFLRGHLADCPRRHDLTLSECNCTNPAVIRASGPADGLPQQSLKFYREFLRVENPNEDHLVKEIHTEAAVAETHESSEENEEDAPIENVQADVKQEIPEDPVESTYPNQNEDNAKPSRATNRILKKLKAMKKESTPALERNVALPLKNVIQGSKTVAAAVAAALGTDSDLIQRRRSPTRTIVPSVHVSNAVPPASSRLEKRDAPTIEDVLLHSEESDLALGTFSKRTRISTSSATATNSVETMAPVKKRLKRSFKGRQMTSDPSGALNTSNDSD